MLQAALGLVALATALLGVRYLRALGSLCFVSVVLFAALALARRDLRRSEPAGT